MGFYKSVFIVICCVSVALVDFAVSDDIDLDYYFGFTRSGSRTVPKKKYELATLKCDRPLDQLFCKSLCRSHSALCLQDKCYCIYAANQGSSIVDIPKVEKTKARRHQIAHFCPNLEVARQCIRTCIAEGKPAFCGKDHVCYCGHKYHENHIDTPIDVKQVYGQFNDLYEKYFGPKDEEDDDNQKTEEPTNVKPDDYYYNDDEKHL